MNAKMVLNFNLKGYCIVTPIPQFEEMKIDEVEEMKKMTRWRNAITRTMKMGTTKELKKELASA